MNIREACEAIRGALGKVNIVPAYGYFCFDGERVSATNGTLFASAPCTPPVRGLVPAEQLLAALAIASDPLAQLTQDGDTTAVLRGGNTRAKLNMLPLESFPRMPLEPSIAPAPPRLKDGLSAAASFIATVQSQPQFTGVWLSGDMAIGTNAHVLVGAEIGGEVAGNPASGIVVPSQLCDYVNGQQVVPSTAQVNDTASAITLGYPSGVYVRSLLIGSQFPEAARTMLENNPPTLQLLAPRWREAVEKLAPHAKDGVLFYPDRIVALGDLGELTEVIETPLGELQPARFNSDYMRRLAGMCDRFDMRPFPGQCLFAGPGFHGLIAPLATTASAAAAQSARMQAANAASAAQAVERAAATEG